MAKSLRSKWRRKCRAVKRERYNLKELERLKKTLENDPARKPEDVVMKVVEESSNVIEFVDKKSIEKKKQDKSVSVVAVPDADEEESASDGEMEVVSEGKVYNKRTMKDQNGCYPIWWSQRRIKAAKKAEKIKAGKIKKKKTKSRR